MLKSDGLGRATTIAAGLALAALLAVVILWGARPAEAAFPGENGKIVFERLVDSNKAFFTMNRDGSKVTRLIDSLGYGGFSFPTWSPDGQKIEFGGIQDGDSETFVMNKDGSEQKKLTNNSADDSGPVWSPDGKKIAFASTRDGDYEIFVMNIDGSRKKKPTDNNRDDYSPDWQPIVP